MGDGVARSYGLIICTDSYSVLDVVRLMNVLIIKYRLECKLRYHRPTHPRIYIRQGSMPILRGLVRPYMANSMLYKIGMSNFCTAIHSTGYFKSNGRVLLTRRSEGSGSFGHKSNGSAFYQIKQKGLENYVLIKAICLIITGREAKPVKVDAADCYQLTLASKLGVQKAVDFFSSPANYPLSGYKLEQYNV
jgi:hypothetical protein